jgi:hypothetical protein
MIFLEDLKSADVFHPSAREMNFANKYVQKQTTIISIMDPGSRWMFQESNAKFEYFRTVLEYNIWKL